MGTMMTKATTECTWFSVLPPDCLDIILSFLSLRDCLTFGSTSLTLMGEIRSDLQRRRKKMTESSANTRSPGHQYNLVYWNEENVRDRVESLYHALSMSHPLSAMALELLEEINRQHEFTHSDTFEAALVIHRNLTRSHRLYANLLSRAMYAHPLTGYALYVPLERYKSDVLCAFYLMGPVVAGIVEGCPTEEAWLNSILSVDDEILSNGPCILASLNTTYRAWIYLHSTWLRLAPSSLGRGFGLSDPHLHFREQEFQKGREFLKRHPQVKEELVHWAPDHVYYDNRIFRGGNCIFRDECLNPMNLSSAMLRFSNSMHFMGFTFTQPKHLPPDDE